MRKTAALGSGVQGHDGVGAQRAEAHRRDVEDAGFVRLLAPGADGDAEVVAGNRAGRDGMHHPLKTSGVYVQLRAKGTLVRLAFGALVDQRALRPREGHGLGIVLNKVLADFGADEFEEKTQMGDHRVVAQNRAAVLGHIAHANHHQHAADDQQQDAATEYPLCCS